MSAYQRFHGILKRDFWPLLQSEGFSRSGLTLRRIRADAIDIINIQGSTYGGKCCVNLGVHFAFLPLPNHRPIVILGTLGGYDCAFRRRLHAPHESDHWWLYGIAEAEAERNAADLIDAYRENGRAFFRQFEPFPDVFNKVTCAEIEAGQRSDFFETTNIVRAALTMARIMDHLRLVDRRKQFAEIALKRLVNAPSLQAELERLRDSN